MPYDQNVTFTATVVPRLPGANPVTGPVDFYDGSELLASVTPDASGNAAFSTSSLAVGSHPITAAFQGDGFYDASASAPVDEEVETTPVWTNGSNSLANATVDVGQICNLPTVTYHDADAGSSHTVQTNWGDGTVTGSTVHECLTDPADPTQGLDGTISDGHAFSALGTYSVTITLTDDAGLPISTGFQVTVVNSAVALTGFTPLPDHSELQVQYTVSGANSAPFNIEIYTSTDGAMPDHLLTFYPVTAPWLLAASASPYTLPIPANYADPQEDYHLIAVADAAPNNSLEFAGGIFQATDNTVTPAQPYICVFGTAAGGTRPGDTVTIEPAAIDFDSQSPYTLPSGTIPIHVRGEYGNNALGADPSQVANVTNPLWLFGGPGNNMLTGASGGNVIVDGGGQNVVHYGNGGNNSAEIVDNSDTTAAFPGLTNNYSETGGGWAADTSSAVASAYNGDQQIGPASTGSTATWTLTGLAAGSYYDVYVTWSPEAARPHSAVQCDGRHDPDQSYRPDRHRAGGPDAAAVGRSGGRGSTGGTWAYSKAIPAR